MDIDAFLKRTNRTKADLLRELGCDPKSSLISSYIAGRAFPPYDVCLKLVNLGITPRELFGEEVDEKFREYYRSQEGEGVSSKPITRAEVIALFNEFKDKYTV